MSDPFAPGFIERPYWWDAAPPTLVDAPPLPDAIEVANKMRASAGK